MPHPLIALPPAFRSLAWANLAAQAAEQISLAAVPIVAVLALHAGAGATGALATAQTLPFLLLSIPLGLLVDRSSRRRLMVVAEALRAGSLALMLWLAWQGGLSLWALAALGFIGASGTVGFSVAAPALVPALVPHEALARANGRLELARSAAFMGGPALAGSLVAWSGAPAAFALATALSLAALNLLWRLPEPARGPLPPRRHPLTELLEGARTVWKHPLLRPILLTSVAWNIAWFVLQAVYVAYAVRVMGLSAATVGTTLAIYGVGMVSGALMAPRLIAALPLGRAILVGPAMSVIACTVMVATLWLPHALAAGLSFFIFGAGPALWVITSTTLRQTVTPPAMLAA